MSWAIKKGKGVEDPNLEKAVENSVFLSGTLYTAPGVIPGARVNFKVGGALDCPTPGSALPLDPQIMPIKILLIKFKTKAIPA